MRTLLNPVAGILLLANAAFAQIDTVWSTTIGAAQWTQLNSVIPVADGGFVTCGQTYVDEPFYQEFLVARTTVSGNTLWVRHYGGEGVQGGDAICEDGSGGFVCVGMHSGPGQEELVWIVGISANGDSVWSRTYSGADPYQGLDIVRLENGAYVIVGTTHFDANSETDIWLLALDTLGDSLWSRVYDIDDTDIGRTIIQLADGNLLIGGQASNYATGAADALVLKTEPFGDEIWHTRHDLGENFGSLARDAAEDENGDLYLCGVSNGIWWFGFGFALKLNSAGQYIWGATDPELFGSDYTGIVPEHGGGCTIIGTVWADFGWPWALVKVFDNSGMEIDSWMPEEMNNSLLGGVSVPSGGAIACGFWGYNTGQSTDGYLLRLGSPTSLVGTIYEVDTQDPVSGVRVELTRTGEFGYSNEEGRFELMASVDTTGIVLSSPCITTQNVEQIVLEMGQVNEIDFTVGIPRYDRTPSSLNLAVPYDDPETVIVTIYNTGSGSMEFSVSTEIDFPDYEWLTASPAGGVLIPDATAEIEVTVAPDSEQGSDSEFFGWVRIIHRSCPDSIDNVPVTVIALDTDGRPDGVPREFALHPAYPNPFNATTSIRFDLPNQDHVRLALFDLLGRQVRTLAEGEFSAGSHVVSLSLPDLPSGVYLTQMQAGEFSAVQKIVLLK